MQLQHKNIFSVRFLLRSGNIFWGEKEAAVCRQSSVLHCETTPIGWCLSTHTSLEYYGMAHSVSMETATLDAVSYEINYSTCILVNLYLKIEHHVCMHVHGP